MRRKILQFKLGELTEKEEEVRQKDSSKERKRLASSMSLAMNLGGSIVLPIVGGTLLGAYLDNLFSSSPKATLTLLFLGVIVGFYSIIRLTRDIS